MLDERCEDFFLHHVQCPVVINPELSCVGLKVNQTCPLLSSSLSKDIQSCTPDNVKLCVVKMA